MSKQVTDRQGATELVVRAAETYAERVSKAFEAEFSRYVLGKERMPDIGLALKLVARALRDRRKTLVDATDATDASLADSVSSSGEAREREAKLERGPKARSAEEDLAAKLSAEILAIRGAIESLYGAPGLRALGLDCKSEVEPKAVLTQARELASRLGSDETDWPPAIRTWFTINAKQLSRELAEPITVLDEMIARSGPTSGPPDRRAAREARARAVAANDDLFNRGAELISAVFRLVGDEDLALKVRPSASRPGCTVLEEQAERGDPGALAAGSRPGGVTPA